MSKAFFIMNILLGVMWLYYMVVDANERNLGAFIMDTGFVIFSIWLAEAYWSRVKRGE